jgi:uncharacterized protein (DUF2235 family)
MTRGRSVSAISDLISDGAERKQSGRRPGIARPDRVGPDRTAPGLQQTRERAPRYYCVRYEAVVAAHGLEEVTGMAKNIVVLSDGTAKQGGIGADTNVYRLFKMLENRTTRQVVFYDPGVGSSRWDRLRGGVFGRGLSRNVQDGYRFIFDQFEAGDQIFLFGFSRGAATVRSLSAFVHMFGVLPKSRPDLIEDAYGIYKRRNATREQEATAFVRRHHTIWTRVKFLGVWDTVSALGGPAEWLTDVVDRFPWWRHRFHDLRLSEAVDHAYQALAIDDEREVFHPQLWEPEVLPRQTMRQVWFPGMHSDVGGGYADTALADITLGWMVAQAEEQGLRVYSDHEVELKPDPDGRMHDSTRGAIGRFYRKKTRS